MNRYGIAESTAKHTSIVTVNAPGRLHLGFLDPGASLGRRFGSLGLVIDGISTTLDARLSSDDEDHYAAVPSARDELPRVQAHVETLRNLTGNDAPVDVRLRRTLPAHAGLGSGTQLALTVGHAFARLHGLDMNAAQLAPALARGARSGVGIAGFERGGLIVDGGPRGPGVLPPVLSRFDFPSAWRVMLVFDDYRTGLSGPAEREALAALPPFPQALAAHACHLTLMQILPAVAEHEFAPFAQGVSALQDGIGRYFAKSQGGIYTSPDVGRVLDWISARYCAGVGQSSWGPTGFAIMESQEEAEHALRSAREAKAIGPGLRVEIVRGLNSGATVSWASAQD